MSNFSLLVIDPGRGEDNLTLLTKLCDGSLVPANRHTDDAERIRRLDMFNLPCHLASSKLAARPATVLLSKHSFTPQLRGYPLRPSEISVLYASNTRSTRPLIEYLLTQGDLTVGDNEP